jgi:hypothetical protein
MVASLVAPRRGAGAGALGFWARAGGAQAPLPPPALRRAAFALRSHRLDAPWASDDDAWSSASSDAGSDAPTAPEPSTSSSSSAGAAAAADLVTPSAGSASSLAGWSGDDGAPAAPGAPAQPLVCEFREVSARLAGSATAQVDLEVRRRGRTGPATMRRKRGLASCAQRPPCLLLTRPGPPAWPAPPEPPGT